MRLGGVLAIAAAGAGTRDERGRGQRRLLERWRAYLGGDDLDEPAEVVFYCAECAAWEFDDLR